MQFSSRTPFIIRTFSVYVFGVALVNYLSKLYCVCALWQGVDIDQIDAVNPNIWNISNGAMTNNARLIWLKSNGSAANMDHLVRLGLNAGCQVNSHL